MGFEERAGDENVKCYYLDSGLWQTHVRKFASDEKAWEGLRKILPDKFVTLYRYEEIPIVDRERYLKEYLQKYGTYEDGEFTPTKYKGECPIPICRGLTNHKWKVPSCSILNNNKWKVPK